MAVAREDTQAQLAKLSAGTLQHVPSQTYTLADRFEERAAGDPDLASSNFVDDDSIIAGALIVDWFKSEIKRVYAALREGEIEKKQRQLIELVRKKGGRITVRELMQSSREYRDSADVANSALQDLVDIRWGSWEDLPDKITGGRPSRVFVLNNETAGNKTPCDKLE